MSFFNDIVNDVVNVNVSDYGNNNVSIKFIVGIIVIVFDFTCYCYQWDSGLVVVGLRLVFVCEAFWLNGEAAIPLSVIVVGLETIDHIYH